MLAVVKPEAAPGADVRQVKIPAFGRTDVLVKVKVASICGTDLHIYEWDRWAQGRIHPPLVPGPRILRRGCGLWRRSDQREGRRLRFRRNARGLRQVPAVPHGRSAHLPEREDHRRRRRRRLRRIRGDPRVKYLEARSRHSAGVRVHPRSAWATPYTRCWRGRSPARRVAITGCGPIGLFAIAVARAVGAAQVFAIEVNEHRRNIAKQMKADFMLDPSKDDVNAIVHGEDRRTRASTWCSRWPAIPARFEQPSTSCAAAAASPCSA